MAGGGISKVFSCIISFLLGFIFGLIATVGAICGLGYYAYTAPIDSIFGLLKVENADTEGRQYVNTAEASTLKDLVSVLSTKVNEIGAQTIDDFEVVFPALETALGYAYSIVNQYADLDTEEFEAKQFMDIVTYLQDVVLSIRPSKVLSALGTTSLTGDDANIVVRALLVGAEAKYVTLDGVNYPVFYDTYIYSKEVGDYYRTEAVNGDERYLLKDVSYLYSTDTENEDVQSEYNVYYIPCIIKDGQISPAAVKEDFNGFSYSEDDKDWVRTKKNDKNEEENITIFEEGENFRYIAVKRGDDGNFTLDKDAALSLSCEYKKDYGDKFQHMTGTYFTTVAETTVTNDAGETSTETAEKEVLVFPITLNSLMNDTFSSLYFVSIADVIKSDSGENKIVNELFSDNNLGDLLDGNIDFDKKIQKMELSTVVDSVEPTNGTMMSLIYCVKNVSKGDDGSYTGTYSKDGVTKKVYITLDGSGYVDKITDESGEEVEGTLVSEIADKADTLEVTDMMTFKPTDAVMAYIGYGVTGVRAESGKTADGSEYSFIGKTKVDGQEKACYIAVDGSGNMLQPWCMDGEKRVNVAGSTASTITDRVNNIQSELALPDIITVTASDKIMLYVTYGISGVEAADGQEYQYTGTYHTGTYEQIDDGNGGKINGDEITYKCYLYTDSETGEIEKVMYDGDSDGTLDTYLYGTVIDGITAKVENLTSDMTIGEVIDSDGNRILEALKDTKIDKIGEAVPNLTISQVIDIGDSKILDSLKDTKINDIGDKISSLKICEILEEEDIDSSSILKQLRNSSIETLSDDISSISIQAIYADDIYGYKEASTVLGGYDSNITYYAKSGDTYTEAADVTKDNYNNGNYYVLIYPTATYTAGYVYYYFDSVNDKFVAAGNGGKLTQAEFIKGSEYQVATEFVSGTTYYIYDGTNYTKATGLTAFADGTTYYTYTQVTYYTYGAPTGMWRLLLCENKTSDGGTTTYKDETIYTIENMSDMIDKATTSIYTSTLKELQDAEIIDKGKDLTQTLTWSENGEEKTVALQDMSFQTLMEAVLAISNAQSKLP